MALNAKGIVHRDLKPQNILLCHAPHTSNPHPSEIQLKIGKFHLLSSSVFSFFTQVVVMRDHFTMLSKGCSNEDHFVNVVKNF